MELTELGNYVCGNPSCSQYKAPYLYPRVKNGSLNKGMRNSDSENSSKPIMRCCPKASFDVRTFFESMSYIGSVQSRKNQYFCYNLNDVYLSMTGLREMTRFNVVKQDDLDIIEEILWKKMSHETFSAIHLQEIIQKTACNSPRINAIKRLQQQKKDKFNEMYWLVLISCYIFTVRGKLILEKEGKGIVFSKNDDQYRKLSDNSPYTGIKFLNNINDNTAAFEMEPFYLEVRCNGYRGSIVPYTIDEIDYLSNIIYEMPPEQKRIDIEKLMEDMDYSDRVHQIYKLLQYRNLRNDRDEREFFERRIKSGLELVSKLKGTVKVLKDGRKRVFFKTPPPPPEIRESIPEKESPVVCCPQAAFDVRSFFASMEYIGSIQSRKSHYSWYRHNNTNLLLTETKKGAPFTVVHDRDLLLLENVVLGKNKPKSFGIDEVIERCRERMSNNPRIRQSVDQESPNKKCSISLEDFVSTGCYILAIKKKLTLYTDSEGVEKFLRWYTPHSQIIHKKIFFNHLTSFTPLDECSAKFNWGDSTWKITCSGYQGFIVRSDENGA